MELEVTAKTGGREVRLWPGGSGLSVWLPAEAGGLWSP